MKTVFPLVFVHYVCVGVSCELNKLHVLRESIIFVNILYRFLFLSVCHKENFISFGCDLYQLCVYFASDATTSFMAYL